MSTFRTLIESLVKNIYVEGLSLEEAYNTIYEDWLDHWNNQSEKEKGIENIKTMLKTIRDGFKSDSNIKIIAKPMRSGEKGWNAEKNSYYAYAKTNYPIDCIDPKYRSKLFDGFQQDIPVSVAFRVSTHDTAKDDDLDVVIPDADKFNSFNYIKGLGGYTQTQSGKKIAFKFYKFDDGNQKNKKADEYADYGYKQIKDKIEQFMNPKSEGFIGNIINNFLDFLYKDYTNIQSVVSQDQDGNLQIEKLQSYCKKNPDLQIWVMNLLENIKNNEDLQKDILRRQSFIDNIEQTNPKDANIFIAQAKNLGLDLDKIIEAQQKAALFQQATDTTKKLDKMAQTQQDHDDMTAADPSKKR
jgi:hypothetical protein